MPNRPIGPSNPVQANSVQEPFIDPPVHYFFEGRSEFERSYERFSDWVVAIA